MRIIQHNDRVLLTQFCLFVFADKLADNKLQISKGVFVAICLITLMVGVVLGGVLCLLVSHNKRRNRKGSKFTSIIFCPLQSCLGFVLKILSLPSLPVMTRKSAFFL